MQCILPGSVGRLSVRPLALQPLLRSRRDVVLRFVSVLLPTVQGVLIYSVTTTLIVMPLGDLSVNFDWLLTFPLYCVLIFPTPTCFHARWLG